MTETKWRTHTVYKGELNGQIVYIGTTIQEPKARFRWHKANGKNFVFTVLARYETAEEMLAEERRLIEMHKPKHNKRLKQNLNVKLTQVQLDSRVNDPPLVPEVPEKASESRLQTVHVLPCLTA